MNLDDIIADYNAGNVLVIDQGGGREQGRYLLYSSPPKYYPQKLWYTGELLPCVGLAIYAEGPNDPKCLAHITTENDIPKYFDKIIIPAYKQVKSQINYGIAGGRRGDSEEMIAQIKEGMESVGGELIHERVLPETSPSMGIYLDLCSGRIGSVFEERFTHFHPKEYPTLPIPNKIKKLTKDNLLVNLFS